MLELKYNSTYISINLIDELDYIVGGYGKPNIIFLYSLNTFLEAFVFNSNFYISDQEAKHFQIVSKSMFPNGRPILELLGKCKSLMAITGIGNNIGTVVSLGKLDPINPKAYQERIQDYIENGLDTQETRSKYLILPEINGDVEEINYLNIGKIDDGYVATESKNKPSSFYSKLCEVTKFSNVQSSLPYYSYKFQINDLSNRGISKEIISNLYLSFKAKQAKIENYYGCSHQSIPPLVSILLSQCNSINDIPSKILQLRQDFTELRNSIVSYEQKIDSAVNIKDQLNAIDEINEFWNLFNKKYSGKSRLLYNFWEIAKESDYEKSLDNTIDTKEVDKFIEDLNIGKVTGKGVKKIYDWYSEKKIINRFRGITDIWKLYENSQNFTKQIKKIENLFDVVIDSEELVTINKLLERMKKV